MTVQILMNQFQMEADKNVITPKLAQHHQQKLRKVNTINLN